MHFHTSEVDSAPREAQMDVGSDHLRTAPRVSSPQLHQTRDAQPLTATLLLPFHVTRSPTPAPGKEFSQLCPT